MTLLFILNLESESVGLYSSQLNSFRSDTGFSGGPEKFCVSTRQADEHVTKISATAFGQSSTGSWWAREQDIGHGFWATLDEQCSFELYEIGLSLTCTFVIAKIGRTRVETKPAGEFGKDVGIWKMSPFTWWKCFPPKEIDSRQHVDGTVKLFRDTEGCVSERNPVFKRAVCVPPRGMSIPFVYRHVRNITAFQSLRWHRSFVSHVKKLSIARSNTSFAGKLQIRELTVKFGGRLGECLSTQNIVHETWHRNVN